MLKKIRHFLEYVLAMSFMKVFQLIPESFARSLAKPLSRVWFFVDIKRKNIARRNICRAMPETYNKENVDNLVKEVFRNFTLTFFEVILYIQPNDRKWIDKNVEIIGGEHLDAAIAKGKGVISFTGHYGGWELTSIKSGLEFGRVTCVYRPLDNPYLNTMLLESRLGYNQELAPKQGATRALLKALKKKEIVGLLVDQHFSPYRDGIWARFFNRDAATTPIIAQLYKHTGAPVIPVFCERTPEGRTLIHFEKELKMESGEDEIEKNTQKVNDVLEEHIRKRPGHWLWIHRRWKTSPDEKD